MTPDPFVSAPDDLGSMSGEFIKGKGWKKKLQIGQEKNTSCDGIFNERGDENIRIENQPHALAALA